MTKLIEFTTTDEIALSAFPPQPASAAIPDWYRALPLVASAECSYKEQYQHNFKTRFSIKGCVPVQDYLTSGYVLRLHTDVGITVEEVNGEEHVWWYTGDGPNCISIHNHVQCPVPIEGKKKTYIKFELPWVVTTPPGYSCLFYQPEFLFNENFRLFPAIVDCDTYGQQVNFPGYTLKHGSFKIDAGTPLIVVLPYKRDEWASKTELVSESQPNLIARYFERGYKKLFHNKKSFK
jgi:hypothetical protein